MATDLRVRPEGEAFPMDAVLSQRLFTVAEFHRMSAAGILHEEDRVELVEGRVVEMPAIGSQHAACVGRLTRLLVEAAGDAAIVWVQNPVRLDRFTELLPDLALLRPQGDFYAQAAPGPGDVLLLIEVADTTLRYDREVKLSLYARAGVTEVWLVNLPERLIEVFRAATTEGYVESKSYSARESIESSAVPGLKLEIDSVLG